VPKDADLRFFGNAEFDAKYRQSIATARSIGGTEVQIDFTHFAAAAALLYGGPWVAERMLAPRALLERDASAIHPVVRAIVERGKNISGAETFAALHALARLRQTAEATWEMVDVLLLPTAGNIYTLAEIEADPVALNSNLGYYTNFVNLMDLCGVAVPAGFVRGGLPFGVTLVGRAGQDESLLGLADDIHRAAPIELGESCNETTLAETTLAGSQKPNAAAEITARAAAAGSRSLAAGATGLPLPAAPVGEPVVSGVLVAVVGAHLSGQPLNWQLTDRRAALVRTCRTAAKYRLVALPGTTPPKPGLLRGEGAGAAIEVEVWEMSVEAFGSFVAAIPPPLGIGTVELDDGQMVKCFLVESYAAVGAADISHFGGWRAYLKG
jgi:allophanate hydrolase